MLAGAQADPGWDPPPFWDPRCLLSCHQLYPFEPTSLAGRDPAFPFRGFRSQDGVLGAQALGASSVNSPLVTRCTFAPGTPRASVRPPGGPPPLALAAKILGSTCVFSFGASWVLSCRPLGTTKTWGTEGAFSSTAPALLKLTESLKGVRGAAFLGDCPQEEISAESVRFLWCV